MSKVFLSVVIPTYQRNDLLSLCLDRLNPETQSLASEFYEVIVTDDGSKTTAEELIKTNYPWAKWVQGPRKGPAANRNNGAKNAQGEWLVFTDDDCLPQKDWLETYHNQICQKNGTSKAFEGAILPDYFDLLKREFAECPINTNGGCFWSANITVEKELFQSFGGFDEGYALAAQEDQQLYLDILKKTSVPFLEKAVVIHPVRYGSLTKYIIKINKKSANFVRYAIRNKKELGYTTTFKFAKEQFIFHALTLKNKILHRKFQEALISICWLVYGVPLNIIRFKLNG